ncbi:MAG: flagellar biosynthetic protein FliO [Planctomycetota bacterium]
MIRKSSRVAIAVTILLSLLIGNGKVLAEDEFPSLAIPTEAEQAGAPTGGMLTGPLVTSGSALLIVLSIFGGLVWVQRRYGSQQNEFSGVPESVFQRLGTVELDSKSQATIVKFGDRLLLVGQTTSGQPQTLAEVTDPEEVDRMTNRCLGRPEIVGRRTIKPRRNVAAG